MPDLFFPICVTCGRRGDGIAWWRVSTGGRFGECRVCKTKRAYDKKRQEYLGDLDDSRPDPWVL